MAPLVDLSRNKMSDKKYSIFARWQHLILPLFGGGLYMCVCCCTCVAYVCAYVREKVMFEVYGGESESMSDQYRIIIFFSHLLSILHFAVWQLYADLSCLYSNRAGKISRDGLNGVNIAEVSSLICSRLGAYDYRFCSYLTWRWIDHYNLRTNNLRTKMRAKFRESMHKM